MNIGLNNTQIMLRDTLRRFLTARDPNTNTIALWQTMAEDLGVLAAPLEEELGGLGGFGIEAMIIATEIGRALAPVPYSVGAELVGPLLAACNRHGEMQEVVAGKIRVALAGPDQDPRGADDSALRLIKGHLVGRKQIVADAGWATHLLLSAHDTNGDMLMLLVPKDGPGITTHSYPLLDGRQAGDFQFDDCGPAQEWMMASGPQAETLLETAINRAIAAQCAEAVGIVQVMLEQTVAYVKQRQQFGRPIADFQAIQHHITNMRIEVEQAESMALMAAFNSRSSLHVSAAKARCDQALRFVSHYAVQLHGGIGTTEELPLSGYFRRALVLRSELGSTARHLARYERLAA